MLIFKIMRAEALLDARREGVYRGSEKDREDGFLHFSTAEQLRGTLKKHYRNVVGSLAIVAMDSESFGEALRWEQSRDDMLFPHLYADLPMCDAIATLITHYETLSDSDFATLDEFLANAASDAHERR